MPSPTPRRSAPAPLNLTRRQAQTREAILALQRQKGVVPTTSEIAAEIGVSKSTAHGFIEGLIARGHARRLAGSCRSLTLILPAERGFEGVA